MNMYLKSLIATALVFATFTPVTASPMARHVGRQEGSIPVGPQPTALSSLNGTQEMPSSAVLEPTTSYSTQMPSSATAEPTSISSVGGSQSVPSASSSISETMTFFPPCYMPTPSTDTLTNGSSTTFEGGSSTPASIPGVSTSESVTLPSTVVSPTDIPDASSGIPESVTLSSTAMPSPTEIPDASTGISESATLPATVMSPPTEVPGGNTGSSESATLSTPSSPTAVPGVSTGSPGSMTVDTTAAATET